MEFWDIIGKINYNFREDKHYIFQYEVYVHNLLKIPS